MSDEVVLVDFQEECVASTESATIVAEETETEEKSEIIPMIENIRSIFLNGIAALEKQISDLTLHFENQIANSEHNERIISQLHNELQKYKSDLYFQLVKPIIQDIIEMRDGIMKMSSFYRNKPTDEQLVPISDIEAFAKECTAILERNDVEIYSSEPGTNFISKGQKVADKTPTCDSALQGKLIRSLSDGYRYKGWIVSPEKVAVWNYEEEK